MIRLAVRVTREHAEVVLAELLELAPAGIEEVDVGEGVVEYAVYGAPGEIPALPALRAVAGDALLDVSSTEVPDDWHERWKRFHRPVFLEAPSRSAAAAAAVPALHVRPPWEAPRGVRDEATIEIVIDPGQAFGTGAHASTRLCLELLLELASVQRARGPLLDVGTGSGVLAIAAARLGFHPVLGLDNEHESVSAARENALVNGVEIEVRPFDLRRHALPWSGGADTPAGSQIVLANLLSGLLVDLADSMKSAPAHLLAGGLLHDEVDHVAGVFADRLGLCERERRTSGEWAALWLAGG